MRRGTHHAHSSACADLAWLSFCVAALLAFAIRRARPAALAGAAGAARDLAARSTGPATTPPALRFAERALPLVVREFGPEHEQTSIQILLAGPHRREGRQSRRGAKGTTRDRAHAREGLRRAGSAGVAEALEALGAVHIKLGRPDAAEPLFQRALKINQDLIGSNHAFQASGHCQPRRRRRRARQLAGGARLLSRGDPADDWAGHLADRRQVDRRGRDQALSRHLRRALPRRLADQGPGAAPIAARCSRRPSRRASRPGTPRPPRRSPR